MRGLMACTSGKSSELPIKANCRGGRSGREFFLSSHCSRKARTDTALKTADSGYMTRRLVDGAQEVIVRENDCFEARGERIRGLKVAEIRDGQSVIEPLEDRIRGRVAAEDVIDPKTGEVLVHQNELIDHNTAQKIIACRLTEVLIRSVLTCPTQTPSSRRW